jgi:hypothetical protein
VDDALVQRLETKLQNDTGFLNVEHLEQLRATCLGVVWKGRTEWNRDEMVQELLRHVGDYIEEVAFAEDGWAS